MDLKTIFRTVKTELLIQAHETAINRRQYAQDIADIYKKHMAVLYDKLNKDWGDTYDDTIRDTILVIADGCRFLESLPTPEEVAKEREENDKDC